MWPNETVIDKSMDLNPVTVLFTNNFPNLIQPELLATLNKIRILSVQVVQGFHEDSSNRNQIV
jgi:hypothetical protein